MKLFNFNNVLLEIMPIFQFIDDHKNINFIKSLLFL